MPLVRATRKVATAILAASAVLSQPALASDCSAIEAIAAAQPGGFESITGETRKIGSMTYTYLLTVSPDIAGFADEDCRIRPYSSTVEMNCTATFENEDTLAGIRGRRHRHRSLPLSQEQLRYFSGQAVDHLCSTRCWRQRFLSRHKAYKWRRPAALFPDYQSREVASR